MSSISVQTTDGYTIEVKRAADGGIVVRHTQKDETKFGEFITLDELSKQPGAWKFLAERGVYTNSELGREALEKISLVGFLIIDGEQILVGPEDTRLIQTAISQLD